MLDLSQALLLIEDEPPIRRGLCATLQASGYQVIAAATAQEGCPQAAVRQPALILLDLGLPDLDGLEVTRRLREWATMPIIVLSARGRESDKIAAFDAGAYDYLTKPFGMGELLARIRVEQVIAQHRRPAVFIMTVILDAVVLCRLVATRYPTRRHIPRRSAGLHGTRQGSA
jgi:two-component system KDP operon response regulator KdpE